MHTYRNVKSGIQVTYRESLWRVPNNLHLSLSHTHTQTHPISSTQNKSSQPLPWVPYPEAVGPGFHNNPFQPQTTNNLDQITPIIRRNGIHPAKSVPTYMQVTSITTSQNGQTQATTQMVPIAHTLSLPLSTTNATAGGAYTTPGGPTSSSTEDSATPGERHHHHSSGGGENSTNHSLKKMKKEWEREKQSLSKTHVAKVKKYKNAINQLNTYNKDLKENEKKLYEGIRSLKNDLKKSKLSNREHIKVHKETVARNDQIITSYREQNKTLNVAIDELKASLEKFRQMEARKRRISLFSEASLPSEEESVPVNIPSLFVVNSREASSLQVPGDHTSSNSTISQHFEEIEKLQETNRELEAKVEGMEKEHKTAVKHLRKQKSSLQFGMEDLYGRVEGLEAEKYRLNEENTQCVDKNALLVRQNRAWAKANTQIRRELFALKKGVIEVHNIVSSDIVHSTNPFELLDDVIKCLEDEYETKEDGKEMEMELPTPVPKTPDSEDLINRFKGKRRNDCTFHGKIEIKSQFQFMDKIARIFSYFDLDDDTFWGGDDICFIIEKITEKRKFKFINNCMKCKGVSCTFDLMIAMGGSHDFLNFLSSFMLEHVTFRSFFFLQI